MAIKQLQFTYTAKNFLTGLTDVKGQCYFNGTAKAVGGSALVFSALDATNSPGLYILTISAATLATWGVAAGQSNTVEVFVNSVTAPAGSAFREEVLVDDSTDVYTLLGTPAGASVSADIATANAAITSLSTFVETGTSSLPTILAAINALSNGQSSRIGGVPPVVLVPASGSNTYQAQFLNFNAAGAPANLPTAPTCGLLNASGTSRASYLSSTTMANPSTGVYTVTITIASGSPEEQLILSVAANTGTTTDTYYYNFVSQNDISADGLAQQATLLATQTTVNSNNTILTNGTYGNAALQAYLASYLANATYGLPAIQTQGATANTSLTAIEGTGFTTANNSLVAITNFLSTYLYTGGRAV